MSSAVNQSPCPQCDQLIPVTLATSEPSDQLAAEHADCPHCNAALLRAVDSHTDRGWRVREPSRPVPKDASGEMSEQHRVVGEANAEPLPEGRVGVRVRIALSGCPSRRWSLDLSARLVNEVVGHRAVGHLRLNHIVQGDQLVLDGVEEAEAPLLSEAIARAIDATNAACEPTASAPSNLSQREADTIASKMT